MGGEERPRSLAGINLRIEHRLLAQAGRSRAGALVLLKMNAGNVDPIKGVVRKMKPKGLFQHLEQKGSQ